MRRDFQPARPADAHSFDAIKESADERPPVDADFGNQRLAVVIEPRDTDRPPRGRPANRFSPVQPNAKTDPISVLAPHRLTRAWDVCKQCETGSQALPSRLASPP